MIVADLHIHSRYSRATAKSLDPEHLHQFAQLKGIDLLGTGDLTHPEWLAELEEKLEWDGEGAYRLKPELAAKVDEEVPGPCRSDVRFVLSGEISSIYKRHGKTRKVHNLILLPDFAAAHSLQKRLDAIGNIKSDGRPILGLDSRDLLELCLEVDERVIFIPAHIWTPWFSLFGSKSGFDSIEECFDDLTGHIHALETGLSSDPPMNQRLSALDRFVLVSNSDAHSPAKLAREANLIDGPPTFETLHTALAKPGGKGLHGTLEFYPDEGKYHLDGHRKCGLRLSPEQTRAYGGRCPNCGGLITVGVLSRVEELADRAQGVKGANARHFESLVPLAEVASEAVGKGPATKAVAKVMDAVLGRLGPELFILRQAALEDIGRVGGEVLAEAVRRMREGQVIIAGGYDGEFGKVSIFSGAERERIKGQGGFWKAEPLQAKAKEAAPPDLPDVAPPKDEPPLLTVLEPAYEGLSEQQSEAAAYRGGPLLVRAGPGSGKTRMLTHRVVSILAQDIAPEKIAAVTFTRKAAGEMRRRLAELSPAAAGVWVGTFHALGRTVLSEDLGKAPLVAGEDVRLAVIKTLHQTAEHKPARLASMISLAKQSPLRPDDPYLGALLDDYQRALGMTGRLDLDDLVSEALFALERNKGLAARWRWRFRHILIDEYQDVNPVQAALLKALCSSATQVAAIGDPDQAIYGFRGADRSLFSNFSQDFAQARSTALTRCYRNSPTILAAAQAVMAVDDDPRRAELQATPGPSPPVVICRQPGVKAEAAWVAERIVGLMGGLDSRQVEASGQGEGYGAGDFAVLYRLHSQAKLLAEALEKAGVPVQVAADEPLAETESLDFTAQRVSLLTMHAAKGLEFAVVFVVGAEERLLPYEPPGRDPAEEAEERRLFYVAMTRAGKRLFISHCARRSLYGKTYAPMATRFLKVIPADLIEREHPAPRRRKSTQLDLF